MPKSRWTLVLLALAILTLALSAIIIFWQTILYGLIAWAAWRMLWHRLIGSSLPRRRGKRGGAIHKWADTAALAAIAYRVGPRQAKKTDGIPQRILKRQALPSSQIAADDPRWDDDPHFPFNPRKYP